MSETYQIVFRGEVLPGFDPVATQTKLAVALKAPADKADSLLSGRPFILRRNLPASEIDRYVSYFASLGARIHAEPMAAAAPAIAQAAAPAASPVASPYPAVATAAPVLVDEMICPKCGEHQPRRTLCRACAVDMKRFAEAKEEAEREERAARLAATRGETTTTTSAPAFAYAGDAPGMIGLGFSGRLGRIEYLFGGLLSLALIVFGIFGLLRSQSIAIFIVAIIVSLVMSIRLSVLRCHDIGWSGWLSLILFIPYLGWLFSLGLLVLPGQKQDNGYGTCSRSAPLATVALAIVVFGASIMTISRIPDAMAQIQMAALNNPAFGKQAPLNDSPQGVGATHASVEIFTTTTCSECARAKSYMRSQGIQYVERDVELDLDNRREFAQRGGYGVPYIFVRGQSMHGFDEGVFNQLYRG